jgi:hypothetical protein
MSFLLFLVFSSTKLENKRAEQVLSRRVCVCGGGEVVQIMYAHMGKCKDDKILKKVIEILRTVKFLNTNMLSRKRYFCFF